MDQTDGLGCGQIGGIGHVAIPFPKIMTPKISSHQIPRPHRALTNVVRAVVPKCLVNCLLRPLPSWEPLGNGWMRVRRISAAVYRPPSQNRPWRRSKSTTARRNPRCGSACHRGPERIQAVVPVADFSADDYRSTWNTIFPVARYAMILSCSTTHSNSLMRNDMMPRRVLAASVTAVRQASSKLDSDCAVTSMLRTIAISRLLKGTLDVSRLRMDMPRGMAGLVRLLRTVTPEKQTDRVFAYNSSHDVPGVLPSAPGGGSPPHRTIDRKSVV